ncbi:folate-binding protein [Massilia oculi]|uniref:Folate-binding protein n=1 Tax=Massilia hydrophila TaxID=3044279 RepID=A0ABS7YD89_9BURK|nr:folate-binding protein [Massilia oculi]MCA1857669.1 folate-binding protein [Massilia oculi]
MPNWTDTLSALGARLHIDEATTVEDFGRPLAAAELADGFVAVVTDLGIIAADGPDAASFLHSQLTNDVTHLGRQQARLAGYCSPKGRLQASFLVWRGAGADAGTEVDTIYLQLPRALQAPLQKRLSMFVLRAKAKLRDATRDAAFAAVLGLGGARAEAALRRHVPTLPDTPYGKAEGAAGTVIRLADAFGAPRYLWLTSEETAAAALPTLAAAQSAGLVLGGSQAWLLAAIHAGVPGITAATQEQFVPQMVNFELLGGVDFKKGCYPGQEIVARSQYLGKLKRRTALATVASPAARAGDEVYSMADPGQPCGMVVNAAANGLGGADLLVELKLGALGEDVRHGAPGGPALAFQQLPYHLDPLEL